MEDYSTRKALFGIVRYYLCRDSFSDEREELLVEYCLRQFGGRDSESEYPALTFESLVSNEGSLISHIVCGSKDPKTYEKLDRMCVESPNVISIVSPMWIFQSVLQNKLQLDSYYAIDPLKFLSSFRIVLGSSCPEIPKSLIGVYTALIRHAGGQVLSDGGSSESQWYTHWVGEYHPSHQSKSSTDLQATNDTLKKALVLVNDTYEPPQWLIPTICNYLPTQHCVSYQWLDQCFQRTAAVDVDSFLLPKNLSSQAPDLHWSNCIQHNSVQANSSQQSNGKTKVLTKSPVFHSLKFYLAHHLGPVLHEAISERIEALGGTVAKPLAHAESSNEDQVLLELESCTHLVAGYRKGIEFETVESKLDQVQVVASYWVCDCYQAERLLEMPSCYAAALSLREMLHFPSYSPKRIKGMEKCIISVTGFNNSTTPSLQIIQLAIRLMGACYMPQLSRSYSTLLVCRNATGEKFKCATKWGTPCVDPKWLLDCYRFWKVCDLDGYLLRVDGEKVKNDTHVKKFNVDTAMMGLRDLPESSSPCRKKFKTEALAGEEELDFSQMSIAAMKTTKSPFTLHKKLGPSAAMLSPIRRIELSQVSQDTFKNDEAWGNGPRRESVDPCIENGVDETEIISQESEGNENPPPSELGETLLFTEEAKGENQEIATTINAADKTLEINHSDLSVTLEPTESKTNTLAPSTQCVEDAAEDVPPLKLSSSEVLNESESMEGSKENSREESKTSGKEEHYEQNVSKDLVAGANSVSEDDGYGNSEGLLHINETNQTDLMEEKGSLQSDSEMDLQSNQNLSVASNSQDNMDEASGMALELSHTLEQSCVRKNLAENEESRISNQQEASVLHMPISPPATEFTDENLKDFGDRPTIPSHASQSSNSHEDAVEPSESSISDGDVTVLRPVEPADLNAVGQPDESQDSKHSSEMQDSVRTENKSLSEESNENIEIENMPPQESPLPAKKTKKKARKSKASARKVKLTSDAEADACNNEPAESSLLSQDNAPPIPTFLLTGSSGRNRDAVCDKLFQLGANVCENKREYDPLCTHIICSELKRTEKFLAGCAAGKWILKPSYVEDSHLAGCFLPEEGYEWGSSEGNKSVGTRRSGRRAALKDVDSRIWHLAPSYWRNRITSGSPGPFHEWTVCLPPDELEMPQTMLTNIILAGGGQTSDVLTPGKNDKKTVALVRQDIQEDDSWYLEAQKNEIPCLSCQFVIEYISKEQEPEPPQVENYIVTGAKPRRTTRTTSRRRKRTE